MLLKLFIFINVIDIILVGLKVKAIYFPKLKTVSLMCMDNCNTCKKYKKCYDIGKIIRIV